jgi:hypothetical protein
MLILDEATSFISGKYGLKENWDYFSASERLFLHLSSEKGGEASCFLTTYILQEQSPIEAITREVTRRLAEQPTAEQQIYSLAAESAICPMEESIVAQIAKRYLYYNDDFCQGKFALLVYLKAADIALPVIMRYKPNFGCIGDIAEGELPAGTKILIGRNQRLYPDDQRHSR